MIRMKIFLGMVKAWAFITQGKCKYYDVCDIRNPDNRSCTKDRGQFYGFGRYAGCYRQHEKTRGKE